MVTEVCVLLRVYNRIDDLVNCINIIRSSWLSRKYYIIVVFNGEEDGYDIPASIKGKIDKLIVISSNSGHFSGNSRLLLEGLNYIPENCGYTVILEADTWIFGDEMLNQYIEKLAQNNAVWASAQFFRYVRNLATDFAIINTGFIKVNPEVFEFKVTPEYYIANYLHTHGYRYIYIRELMPVNLPRYIKYFPFAPTGRFFVFPKGRMVTHHIEVLKGRMEEKKYHFNVVANSEYFETNFGGSKRLTRWLMNLSIWASYLIPYKGWIFKRKDL